jgi:hypothetical protein
MQIVQLIDLKKKFKEIVHQMIYDLYSVIFKYYN